MAGDLSRWMGAVSDIKKADEYNKKPPLFKKTICFWFCRRRSDANLYAAKKKPEDMRNQLKQIITLTRGMSAWLGNPLRTEGEIRKKRQKLIYDQKERQRKLIEGILIAFLILLIGGAVVGLTLLYMDTRGLI